MVYLNDEWNKNEEDLSKYLGELIDLQHRRADMYINSFRTLKQRFPFFNSVCNWFYPFTLHHKELPNSSHNNRFLSILLKKVNLCDSDKYSFCLMTSQLNKVSDFEQMEKEMLSKMPEMVNLEEVVKDKEKLFKEKLRFYVQGFYRFSNLHPHHNQFVNPFQQNVLLLDYPPLNVLVQDSSMLKRMAGFLFKDNDLAMAQNLLERISPEEMTADLNQKLGYCQEKARQYERAQECYERANLLQSNSKWTLRRLAYTCLFQGNTQRALTFYNELERIDSESVHIALHQAECYIRMEQYESAFKYLFKAIYLAPTSLQAKRALAWCSLLTQKWEQAEKYYSGLLKDNEGMATDYLNAGHTAWLSGNVALAVERYSRAKSLANEEDND